MARLKLVMVIGGLVMAYFGVQEFRLGWGASSKPVDADLAQLESGQASTNAHARLGPCLALYAASIYEYRQGKYDRGEPGPSTSVTHSYFPVISLQHPFVEAMKNQDENFDFKNIAVIVKTSRFKTIGAIPDGIDPLSFVEGTFINRIASLGSDEKKLLASNFPTVDMTKVLILEEGRHPASLLKTIGLVAGGLALSLVGGLLFFWPTQQ